MSFVIFAVDAALICNIVLSRLLRLDPFPESGGGRKDNLISSAAMTVAMAVSGLLCGIVFRNMLVPNSAENLKIGVFTGIVLLVNLVVWLALAKAAGNQYREPGKQILLLALNSAVLGIALFVRMNETGMPEALLTSLAAALGYLAVVFMLTFIEERMEYSDIPKYLKGVPVLLLAVGMMTVAFHGMEVLG